MAGDDLELLVAWERHVGSTPAALEHLRSVTARYREAYRHYHTVRHLTWVVRHVEELTAGRELIDPDATIAAAFYHDVVYDPRRHDNEVVSAALAASALGELAWAAARIERVGTMIIGTADHDLAVGVDIDTAVLYAADLAVLAADPAAYGDYVRNVRREYAHVDDAGWNAGRGTVLQGFLDRPAIFAPVLGLDSWEARARANITSELVSLTR